MSRSLVVWAWIAIAAPALADIYVWTDSGGGEHFVTSLEGVPEDARTSAKLFVRERPRAAPDPTPEAAPPPPAESAPAAAEDEGAIEDRLVDAFAAGVEAGRVSDEDVEVVPPTVVQTTEVYVDAPERDGFVVGGFVPAIPGRRPRGRPPEPERDEDRADFVVGPAGPPPIGAAGPPPVGFE